MKKIWKAILVTIASVLLLSGCVSGGKDKEIKLSFDKSTAYFTSQVALSPIAGEVPAEGDAAERATVTITAENAERIRLCVEYEEGQSEIAGLMIAVDGEAKDLTDGVVLYEGEPQSEHSFSVVIYLGKDAPITSAGKTLSFSFILQAA